MKKNSKKFFVKTLPKSFKLDEFNIPLQISFEDLIQLSIRKGKIHREDLGLQ